MVHSCSTLQRLIQTTKVTKLSFPVSQFLAALSCIPLLKSMSLGFYRLDLEASDTFLPPTYSLPLCPSSPHFSTKGGKWLIALFVLDAFLSYRCYTRKTWGLEFQSPSLLRCRESNTIKKTLARYFGKKVKRRCHLTS